MMTPKTLSNIFAQRVLGNPQHSIFFVGYADPESPAGILKTAKPGQLVSLDIPLRHFRWIPASRDDADEFDILGGKRKSRTISRISAT